MFSCCRLFATLGIQQLARVPLLLVAFYSLKVLLKPGVHPYIAIHASLTASDFLLAHFYPSGPFACIFSKTSPEFFLCWLWLGSVLVSARRIGHHIYNYRQ